MAQLKLGKLPDRKPVKLVISLSPELKSALDDYAVIYGRIYGADEPISQLVPHMLDAFLTSDRAFVKARAPLHGAET